MALCGGPLRTKQLTQRALGVSPRSVYRCLRRLDALGLIERRTEVGVQNMTLIRLSEGGARDLARLLRIFTSASLPPGRIGESANWLSLLGGLWREGFVEELSHGPRSLDELAAAAHPLTYHQVKRRASLALAAGLLGRRPREGNTWHYELTAQGRRSLTLVCGAGRWRRHFLGGGSAGLDTGEMATVLRAALPLARLPEHKGMRIELAVAGPPNLYGYRETTKVRGEVRRDGTLGLGRQDQAPADSLAAATINIWMVALLDDKRGRIRVRCDSGLVDACLKRLYKALFPGI